MAQQDEPSSRGTSEPPGATPMYGFDGSPIEWSTPPPAPAPAAEPDPTPMSPRRTRFASDPTGLDGSEIPSSATRPPPARWGLSIVALLFSFLFGAIALFFSWQVGQRWSRGDVAGSQKASVMVTLWAGVGIVTGALVTMAMFLSV